MKRAPGHDEPLEAAVLDMDGVVTRTARVHQAAWKLLFELLSKRRSSAQEDTRPLSDADYRSHVGGKPLYEGVRAFLVSRGIAVPEDTEVDPPRTDTLQSLGVRKKELFRALVERQVVKTDEAGPIRSD